MDESRYSALAPAILSEAKGDVRVFTLNRPDHLNSVDPALHEALERLWWLVESDASVGAVVLTGAGRAFSAGGHMPWLKQQTEDPIERRRSLRGAGRLAREILACEVPVVAAVNGPAVGLGASLATMCDLVVMARSAYMADPHVNVGLVAGDGGVATWPLSVGVARAREYLLLGGRISAERCLDIGLVNRVVDDDQVLPTALELAEALAAQPRNALRDTKRALNAGVRAAMERVLDFGLAAEGESFTGEAIKATVARFAAS